MMTRDTSEAGLEALEIRLLLEGVFERHGYDFRNYSLPYIARRIRSRLEPENVATVSGLLEKSLHDAGCMERLLEALTIPITAMFRDPDFYRTLREKVLPMLHTYPFVRIWHAGCSSGEEAYSMAILLDEEESTVRYKLYATDISEGALQKAKAGIYSLPAVKDYTSNYIQAGGRRSFSEYYTAQHDSAILRSSLRDNIIFAQHNLVTDASFNEFHLILCRNVMIYFNQSLQERVLKLLYDSLPRFGVLALGEKETLKCTPHEDKYEALDAQWNIFRKVR